MTSAYSDCVQMRKHGAMLLRHDFTFKDAYRLRTMAEKKLYLREWRELRGMTQDRLAEKLDTSKGYLAQMERGERPFQRWLQKFADALDLKPHELMQPPPHLADEGRFYDEDARRAMETPLDTLLMAECIRNAVKIIGRRQNLNDPAKIDAAAADAAEAALETYYTYFRLSSEEENAA